MSKQYIIAVDLGASSGRVMAGALNDHKLEIIEIHRFNNSMIYKDNSYTWDVDYMWHNILHGLKLASHLDIKSIGVDGWAVDYALLDDQGNILDKVYAYRDDRTIASCAKTIDELGKVFLYHNTGLPFLPYNTLYQLKAHMESNAAVFQGDCCLLMLPDYFHFKLSGVRVREFTNFSTTQLFDSKEKKIIPKLLDYLGLRSDIFPSLEMSGTIIGTINDETQTATGLPNLVNVTIPGTHDTASAFTGNIGDEHTVIISSGTWSIMGIITEAPVINDLSLQYGFSNEGGVYGTNRLLKNIMGLWIFNQAREEIAPNMSFAQIIDDAITCESFQTIINPNHESFFNPPSMMQAIQDFAKNTNQYVPNSMGEMARCVFESLALLYDKVLKDLEAVANKKFSKINVLGGGAQNIFLNQLMADIIGVDIIAGPIEATSMGNMIIQMISLQWVTDLQEAKQVIANSEDIQRYSKQSSTTYATEKKIFNEIYAVS